MDTLALAVSQISSRTLAVYESHIRTLIAKVNASRVGDEESWGALTHEELVLKFLETERDILRSTRQIRKSALAHFLKSEEIAGKLSPTESSELQAKVAAVECSWSAQRKTDLAQTPTRKSRESARSIPEKDYNIMREWLEQRFSSRKSAPIAMLTYHYLTASCACGARPIEWATAEWCNNESRDVLRIYSAKTQKRAAWKNIPPMVFSYEDVGQALGSLQLSEDLQEVVSFRLIQSVGLAEADFENRLSHLSLNSEELDILRGMRVENGLESFRDVMIAEDARDSVQFMLDAVQSDVHRKDKPYLDPSDRESKQTRWFGAGYNRIRIQFMQMSNAAFPDRFDLLYSPADCRSTFAANAKAQLGIKGAARLLGHSAVNQSTTRNYASAKAAWARFKDVAAHSTQSLGRTLGPSVAQKIIERERAKVAELQSHPA